MRKTKLTSRRRKAAGSNALATPEPADTHGTIDATGATDSASVYMPAQLRPRRNFAKWRALSLSLVYIVFAIHIIHWKIAGKTLAPLELNEVMYTLELGIITAGFLFMGALVLGTAIFGRFFCSWACHIIVLQDFCAWILKKWHIRAKPIRSRLLLLVPPLTAFYMFVWPQVKRVWYSGSLPTFHLATDADGWASFATHDFWRNLPGPAVIAATFAVCGFAIVYLLGSRTFCTYVCPYGAVFGLADRFAPGRIRVNDACKQCGRCTAVCTSGIRVHEEVNQHGMIVNPACLKDLDCVSVCPNDALQYRFGKPSLLRSFRSGGRFGSVPYDYSVSEDLLIGVVFLVVLLAFRGLYSQVPFLLSLALGAIMGVLSVVSVRLMTRPHVVLARVALKVRGRLTGFGKAYLALVPVLAALIAHSGFIRFHEYQGLRQAMALSRASNEAEADSLAADALRHLTVADRWGLIPNERVKQQLVATSFHLKRFDEALDYARRVLRNRPGDLSTRLMLGQCLLRQGRTAEAQQAFRAIVEQQGPAVHNERDAGLLASAHHSIGETLAQQGKFAEAAEHLRMAVMLAPQRSTIRAELGSLLAELGDWSGAIDSLSEAVRIDPKLGAAQYNLGTIYGRLGRFDEAIPCYESALAIDPDDPDLLNNLGYALMRTGHADEARKHLEHALAQNPGNADVHFNLGQALLSLGKPRRGGEHLREAARLDPRYAHLLNSRPPE